MILTSQLETITIARVFLAHTLHCTSLFGAAHREIFQIQTALCSAGAFSSQTFARQSEIFLIEEKKSDCVLHEPPRRPVKASMHEAHYLKTSLCFFFLWSWSLFRFQTNGSPSTSPQFAADADKVCEQRNVFGQRQPVTMYLLCVYPEVTSILSLGECIIAGACWSPSGCLDMVASIHAKNNTPSSCGMAILLAPLHYFTLTLSLGTGP